MRQQGDLPPGALREQAAEGTPPGQLACLSLLCFLLKGKREGSNGLCLAGGVLCCRLGTSLSPAHPGSGLWRAFAPAATPARNFSPAVLRLSAMSTQPKVQLFKEEKKAKRGPLCCTLVVGHEFHAAHTTLEGEPSLKKRLCHEHTGEWERGRLPAHLYSTASPSTPLPTGREESLHRCV